MNTSPLRIGYCLSLSGALASNGKTAALAHQIWRENVNKNGRLLGRPVELVCFDDQTNPNLVADLYRRLLDVEKVDLVIGGYGDNSVAPAMPLIVERKRFFIGLMALAVNAKFHYPQYFVMIPTGPHPNTALSEGFFEIAKQQSPKPETVAILVADAPFSQSPVQGAKENLARQGMRLISEDKYPLSTTDFRPYMEDLKRINPDVLFLCSYINDSIGLIKAINEAGVSPKIVGGAMIGPQNGVVKRELGALLNGLVNYEYWLPVPSLMNPQIQSLVATCQDRAEKAGADPLGYYVAPMAYAQLQVLEQAVNAVGSLDDSTLSDYTRKTTFETVVGKVTFGEGGGWAEPRVLTVQFRDIKSNNISEFKKPDTEAVVYPPEATYASLIYPYENAKR
ncbi:MAG TPA: amino acid ABC transporter substrate-binding protein [Vicinamibacterales bacterium]|nr:amino acid ABC transporter substrate-binding protein [Vicinamibacterales bacterium]